VYGIESVLEKSATVFCRRGDRRKLMLVGGFIVAGGRGEIPAGGGRIGGGIFFSTVEEECSGSYIVMVSDLVNSLHEEATLGVELPNADVGGGGRIAVSIFFSGADGCDTS
jgi:hypothetical protein